MRFRVIAGAAFLAASSMSACALVLGDFSKETTAGTGGTGGATTGTCTPAHDDVVNCGACGLRCNEGEICQNGTCVCSATVCAIVALCTTLQNTPGACGSCDNACDNDQACVAGACQCRAGLTVCSGACVDLQHNANNCGSCGTVCDQATQRCVAGACQTVVCTSMGASNCSGGCYTDAQLASDPLNCGGCGCTCDADELCIAGTCQGYFPSPYCTTCPCAACGAGTTCCPAAASAVICVTGSACPG
jgi:hypothetical protein